MNRNSLALVITLALDSSLEDVQHAINEINRTFRIDTSGTVSPAELVGTLPHPTAATGAPHAASSIPSHEATAPAPVVNIHTVVTNGEVDKNGLPWDERIHSSSKEKNKDGSWRIKKNVDAAFKAQVETSLRAVSGAPVPAPPTNTAPVIANEPAAVIPAPPALPGAIPPPPLPGANVIDPAYAALVQLVASNTKSDANPTGRLTDEWLSTAAIPHFCQLPAGTKLQDLAHRPDLVAALTAGLKASLA